MKHLLPLLLLICNLAHGQGEIDLEKNYNINAVAHGDKELGQVYTMADVKLKFGAFYTRKTKIDKFTDAQVMTCRVFSAAYMNELVKTCAFGPDAPQLISVVNIALPNGKWRSDLDCIWTYGTLRGKGSFVAYPTNYTTEIVMDNAGWQGTLKDKDGKPLRTLFVSPTYGQEAFVAAYHESAGFYNCRLNGDAPQWHDPSYSSYGLYTFDAGETHDVEKVYAHNFNTAGFAFERGTPATANLLTAFNCNVAAVHLIGTALATMNFGTVSVDDCPAVFRMDAGRGREAGGVLFVACVKKETGVTSEDRGPWKGTIVGDFRGQFAVHIGVISNAAAMVKVNTTFFVDSKLLNGTHQRSCITVGAMKGFNCDALVQDAVNKRVWKSPGDYAGFAMSWTSHNGGKVKVDDEKVDPVRCTCTDRLGFFKGPGTFDYTNCLPKYSYTNP